MLFLILIFIVLLSVNSQDDNKFNIKFIENYNSTKGLFLPWLKVCSDNVDQINKSILVKQIYRNKYIDENFKKCIYVDTDTGNFLCRGELRNGIKILGTVSKYKCFQKM